VCIAHILSLAQSSAGEREGQGVGWEVVKNGKNAAADAATRNALLPDNKFNFLRGVHQQWPSGTSPDENVDTF
jgi:hypothetical protein